MSRKEFNGTAEITESGIKKHFTKWKSTPLQAVIELIANGFDAGASNVNVLIDRNELQGLELITVFDNGSGIDIDKCDQHFSRFNESLKQGNDDLQGSQGKGRLAFHLLCNRAKWYTKNNDTNAIITIETGYLRKFKVNEIDSAEQHPMLSPIECGTCVILDNFTKEIQSNDQIIAELQNQFGWRLALNKNRKLLLNGQPITIPSHDIEEKIVDIDNFSFEVKLLRWYQKPKSEKSFNYLINSDGRIRYKELSSFNKKPEFYLSSYSTSNWVDHFDVSNSSLRLESDIVASPDSTTYKKLKKEVTNLSKKIYEDFLRAYVESKLEYYEDKGYFPSYKLLSIEDAEWRRTNTKSFIRELYLIDPNIFSTLKEKQTKILIALIDKILVSNENDSLFEVIESILELDKNKLACQVKNSSLENIISTIEVLQKRKSVITKLKQVMTEHYKKVLETPDLQQVIENNTWLFGEKYSLLGAEEDNFHKLAKNLRDNIKDINTISEDDLDSEDFIERNEIEGAQKQVDLFLTRKKKEFDSANKSYYKCTIIEIKRPSISLNGKHSNQIKKYAQIISNHPEFSSEKLKFDLILVGRKISNSDFDIPSAFETAINENDPGLAFKSNHGNIRGYVKTWATIFDEFELSNDYLLDKLKLKREDLSHYSRKDLLSDLQQPTE
ncbi:MAG: ATP-binding protein [Gammaproteobacteria bacterium]|nr:ATP-binding protein [Gammaproteobacteria bacterium]MBU1477290.1 ATP-binding protein [Gammaproteobacteria bacterium]MBU2001055.1 ATP-binding protein [Gammaproteobacteria bacterium]MBU2131897.1 ATP-binding protein [Gammaproteobacteria bacterium]MBU2188139.1 ATP-binding protein [Gammaproteobacteria bacterium]